MNCIFNDISYLPKNSFTWHVCKVICDIGSTWAGAFKHHHILCGRRASEIIPAIDTRNTIFEENYLVIRIGDK